VSARRPVVVDLKESDPLCEPMEACSLMAFLLIGMKWTPMLVFWTPEVQVGEEAGFQLSLATPTNMDLSALPIDSVTITFSNGYYPVVLQHSPPTDDQVADTAVRLVKVGKLVPEDEDEESEEISAGLRWKPGERLVVSGSISSEAPGLLTVGVFLPGCDR
jgi:hypothetical protein